MWRSACLLAAVPLISCYASVWAQEKAIPSPKKLSDGVYAVQRESLKETDMLPLKDGEVLVVHRHR